MSKSSIGETHLKMDFSIGLPPETVFDIITSHDNQTYSYFKQMKRRKILVFFLFSFLLTVPFLLSSDYSNTSENGIFLMKSVKSSKVLRDNGRDEKVVVVKKSAPWKFLRWNGKMPLDLVFNENRKDLIVRNLHKYQSSCSVLRELNWVWWADII